MEPWDTNKILKFLDKYSKLPCLWDTTDQLNYRDHEARENAFQTLINYMELKNWSCEQIKKKIRSIRNAYMFEKRRVLKSKKLGYNHIPKLAYYKKADSFLDKIVGKRYTNYLTVKKPDELFDVNETMNMFENETHYDVDDIDKNTKDINYDEILNDNINLKFIPKISESTNQESTNYELKRITSGTDKWETRKILKFLDKFQELPCLWDVNDRKYKNYEARNIALQILIKYMNVPEWSCEQMKKKIRSIRNAYVFEKRRVIKNKKLGHKYVPKLGYFKKANSFLYKVVKHRKNENSFTINDLEETEQDEILNMFENHESDQFNESYSDINNEETNDSDETTSIIAVLKEEKEDVNTEFEILNSERTDKWDTETILKFLDKYRELPCLWDISDQKYKNHEERLLALQNLNQHMNVPHWNYKQMEKRIKFIRENYINEKRRVLKSKELGYNHVPTLAYYTKANDFLEKTLVFQTNKNHLVDKQLDESCEQNEKGNSCHEMFKSQLQNEFNYHLNDEESNDEESNDEELNDKETNDDERLGSPILIENEGTEICKKRKLDDSRTSDSKREADTFFLFGKLVAQQLKELPPIKAYKLEVEIQKLISNAKIETLHETEIIF